MAKIVSEEKVRMLYPYIHGNLTRVSRQEFLNLIDRLQDGYSLD
jgi:hypothetical protein